MVNATNHTINPGTDYPGSSLQYSGVNAGDTPSSYAYCAGINNGVPVGTWRALGMSSASGGRRPCTEFIRIA